MFLQFYGPFEKRGQNVLPDDSREPALNPGNKPPQSLADNCGVFAGQIVQGIKKPFHDLPGLGFQPFGGSAASPPWPGQA